MLAALKSPRYAAAHRDLVDVLISLMMRVDDARIETTLRQLLLGAAAPPIRARIAERIGLIKHATLSDALLQAANDEDGDVRFRALQGLANMEAKLSDAQKDTLGEIARRLLHDAQADVRMEAMIQVENYVDHWIRQAEQFELQAEMAKAESLYTRALNYSPNSKQGNYRLGRFYLDSDRKEAGLYLLRRYGMLLDVPRLARAPEVDGRLDEPTWQESARVDSFFQYSFNHKAALPSETKTELYIGYTTEALFIGFIGHDDHPDSLVVKTREADGTIWWDDVIELFIDTNFDHQSYIHLGVNSIAAISDGWCVRAHEKDMSWNATGQAAAHVGENFWSVEYRLDFAQDHVLEPQADRVWGFNFVRTFRGSEYSQWVRTYHSGGHSPQDFGLLVFH